MIVGAPTEIKPGENRVGLVPVGVETLLQRGHTAIVQRGAGIESGASDEEYEEAGAQMVVEAREVYARSDLIVKVKEPLPMEYPLMRKGQMVFTYFHFAADEALTRAMLKAKIIAIAYETVQRANGELPLLVPMSEVAGRMAVQEGAKYLERRMGGRGILLAGVPGVAPANVVILGGGVVGANAAKMAAGLGANVFVLDIDLEKLRHLDDVMPKNVTTLMSNTYNLRHLLPLADLLIGAVLIPGSKAPKVVTREMLKWMRPGAVIVDVAVDQGGCIETSHPTTHEDPIFFVDGVLHYAVSNMPGAVPRTSTLALTNATLPYVVEIADKGWKRAARENREIAAGINMVAGRVTHRAVADAFGLSYEPFEA